MMPKLYYYKAYDASSFAILLAIRDRNRMIEIAYRGGEESFAGHSVYIWPGCGRFVICDYSTCDEVDKNWPRSSQYVQIKVVK